MPIRPKRPRDTNQLAKSIVDLATAETTKRRALDQVKPKKKVLRPTNRRAINPKR